MNYESSKKYVPVIVAVVLLVLLNLFVIAWYIVPAGPDRLDDGTIPGKVILVTETSFTTRDPRGNTKTFIITPETQIEAGKKNVSKGTLQPGDMVLVELDRSTSTDFVADEIRVFTDKRKDK
jgi:Domain of unknown function (DUF5666)